MISDEMTQADNFLQCEMYLLFTCFCVQFKQLYALKQTRSRSLNWQRSHDTTNSLLYWVMVDKLTNVINLHNLFRDSEKSITRTNRRSRAVSIAKVTRKVPSKNTEKKTKNSIKSIMTSMLVDLNMWVQINLLSVLERYIKYIKITF